MPDRAGYVRLDDTGFPKKGDHSVGVARQYTGTLGQIGNGQVAVTATLWNGVRAWLIGAAWYLPEEWLKDRSRCEQARIPKAVVFQKKWELALGLLRDALAAGFDVAAVLADAGDGDVAAFRAALHELQLSYAVGVASTTSVLRGTPQLTPPTRAAKPDARRQPRPTLAKGHTPITVSALAAALPSTAWRRVTWRNGQHARRAARFAACRVTPAHDWQRNLAPDVWRLCERSLDETYDDKFF